MDSLVVILLFILGLAIYLGFYLAVPLIVAASTKLSKPKINLIVVINVVVVFVLFQLLYPYLITNIVMGVISAFIARRIMIKKCLEVDTKVESTDTNNDPGLNPCISDVDETFPEPAGYKVYSTSAKKSADVSGKNPEEEKLSQELLDQIARDMENANRS